MMRDEALASRMTVLNKLDSLEFDQYITATMDKRNSQTYKLFINQNNLLVAETHRLDTFRKALSDLLMAINTKRKEIDALLRKAKNSGEIWEDIRPHEVMINVYSGLVYLYSRKSVLEWPSKIKDEQLLRNLYQTVFTQLFDIHKIILQRLDRSLPAESMQSGVLGRLVDPFNLDSLDFFVAVFEYYKLLNAATPVIDSLWMLSSPLYVEVKSYIKSSEEEKYSNSELWDELKKEEIHGNWKELLRIWRLVKEEERALLIQKRQ